MCQYSPEARDIVVKNHCALILILEGLREELELHDHVGQPGGDLLLEEEVGAQLVGTFAMVQKMFNGDGCWDISRKLYREKSNHPMQRSLSNLSELSTRFLVR